MTVVCETEVSKLGIINPMGKLFLLDFLFYRRLTPPKFILRFAVAQLRELR